MCFSSFFFIDFAFSLLSRASALAALCAMEQALAEFIFESPSAVLGKRVLDVGCGLGVAGIAAALAGAPCGRLMLASAGQQASTRLSFVRSRPRF